MGGASHVGECRFHCAALVGTVPLASAVLFGCIAGAQVLPESCPVEGCVHYVLERHGQDTRVLAPDGRVVFDTSVDDTSAGSDTDEDLSGGEEFFNGCMWTLRQQVHLCEGGSCADAEIMAHDIQRRLWAFYSHRDAPFVAPPLEDVAWLTHGTSAQQRREMLGSCPGLVVTSLLFMAEVLAFVGSPLGDEYSREAELYIASFEQQAPAQLEMMLGMFPVLEALQGLDAARARQAHGDASVDIVLARCRAPLQWLWEYALPRRTRVFVYEKCAQDGREQTSGLSVHVEHVLLEERTPGLMTGECTAYLAHLAGHAGDLAEFTVFMHDDGPRHIRNPLLGLALGGLRTGAYRVPFLHLSHERYPSFRTPCHRDVYRRAFGRELAGRLTTYCCSHFVVSRDRIAAHPPAFYQHLADLVNEAPYAQAHGGACNIGRKPCYVMEFLWHAVFGEDDELPLRAEQASLPLALRYEGGRASRLPSPLKVAPYMDMFRSDEYSSKLLKSR